MNLVSKLSCFSVAFGLFPLAVLIWYSNKNGLFHLPSFQSSLAIAVMVAVLVGIFSGKVLRYLLFKNRLEAMQAFCEAVKEGHYDQHLPLPNSQGTKEEEDDFILLMRNMNWMAHCIKTNQSDLHSAIESLRDSQSLLRQQKTDLEASHRQQLLIQQQLEHRTQDLKSAVEKLRYLLDNAGQGFLSFGPDLQVAEEYSAECVYIFNQEIAQQSIAALLYPESPTQQAFLTSLFNKIFTTTDLTQRNNYLSLLPTEFTIEAAPIQAEYKLLNTDQQEIPSRIMIILTDLSEKRSMEEALAEEKNFLSMIVQAVTHAPELIKAIKGYRDFCTSILGSLEENTSDYRGTSSLLFRHIHTWKGLFAQLGLYPLAAKLHQLENELSAVREITDPSSGQQAMQTILQDNLPLRLESWLEEELEKLTEVLGESFFHQQDKIWIDEKKLLLLEEKVKLLMPPCKARILTEELRKLRYRPFSELIQVFKEYTEDLATRQNKLLHPIQILDQGPLLELNAYRNFADTLLHLFRNAIAHGIEAPQERELSGKDPKGRILCRIEEKANSLFITIEDDGRGIDNQLLLAAAIRKNLLSQEDAVQLTEEAVLDLIWLDGFSSQKGSDELSGRGVGLYAVRYELEKLHGSVSVKTKKGQGTAFTFQIPLPTPLLEPPDLMSLAQQATGQISHFFHHHFNIQILSVAMTSSTEGQVPMGNLSTFITVEGEISGRFALSADTDFLKYLAQHPAWVVDESIPSAEWLESLWAELFNTILGNTLRYVPEYSDTLEMGTPFTIWADGASARYSQAQTATWQFQTNQGVLIFNAILVNKEDSHVTISCGR